VLLLVLCLAANAVEGRMEHVGLRKRATLESHRELKARQVLGGPGDVGTDQDSSVATVSAAPVTPTASAATPTATTAPVTNTPFNPLTALIPGRSSSDIAAQASSLVASVASPASQSVQSPSSQSSASSSAPTSRSMTATNSQDPNSVDVVNVYSTALIAASLSSASAAAASATESKKSKDDDSSGLSKTSIITIVAIGSSVALIAAIWTIFRKWKLSPSRQFEDKLTPIDWAPDLPGAGRSEDKLALTRSNSDGSGVSSLNKGSGVGAGVRRQNSWGSANGSMHGYGSRTDMAEIPYNNSAMPAYPPANNNYGYTDQYAQSQRYENLQRQPTGFTNGGRYGEGYRPNNY